MRPFYAASLVMAAVLGLLAEPSQANAQRRKAMRRYNSPPPMPYALQMVPPYAQTMPYSVQTMPSSSYGKDESAGQYQAQLVPTVNVGVYDNFFLPSSVVVRAGTTVQWNNYGRHRHTITADDKGWDSGEVGAGDASSYTFPKPGVYSFYCRHHELEMRFTVVVQP